MRLVSPAGPVYQSGTLSGNPLAMTAGLWSLKHLSKGLYRQLAELGAMLTAGLADAARAAGVDLQVNGIGSVLTRETWMNRVTTGCSVAAPISTAFWTM